jgi:hypothetical protein
LPAGGLRSPAQKVYILHKKLSPHGALCAKPVLVESLNSTQALLTRLENGVHVPRNDQREIVRLLYVATRHQVKALAAVLELDGLE